METVIGFAAGYLVGTREGRAGLERLRESVVAITNSPQTRKLAMDAANVAGSIAKRTAARGIAGTAGPTAEMLLRRVTSR